MSQVGNRRLKVWVMQTGEPIHSDRGSPRPMRAMNLANALVAAGHSVTVWSSEFNHLDKTHRQTESRRVRISNSLELRLVPSPGYRRNIGLGRLFDHACLAVNLHRALSKEMTAPDVAFIGYPPIEFAFVAIQWLKKRRVPTMLDAKDRWPEIFVQPFPSIIHPIARLCFFPYYYLGRRAMKEATALCSMSRSFLQWMSDYAKRPLTPFDCVAPLSPLAQEYPKETIAEAARWWAERGVQADGRRRFFFVGSISRAFDFNPLIVAARHAAAGGNAWQFVICGDGEKAMELRSACSGFSSVVMPGWIDRPKIIALAQMSDFGIAPYRNSTDFMDSIPNKIIDYLSLGKPLLTSLRGEVGALIRDHGVGLSYDEKEINSLYDAIDRACSDPAKNADLSVKSIATFEQFFRGEKVYAQLVDQLVSLVALERT